MMKTAAMLCLCLSALALAVSAEEMMMPNATDMGNMTMSMTMNGTEMANDTITDDGRRKLLARSLLEEMMPEMDNMTMNGTMNGTEMANDTIPEEPVSDDGRRNLLRALLA